MDENTPASNDTLFIYKTLFKNMYICKIKMFKSSLKELLELST